MFYNQSWHLLIYLSGTLTRRQRRDFFGLRVKLTLVTTSSNHSKVEAVRLSALPEDTTSELAGLFYTISLFLNIKHGSCEYQFLVWLDEGMESRSTYARRTL